MKLLCALALAALPSLATAATITIRGSDLRDVRQETGDGVLYTLDLEALGVLEIDRITVVSTGDPNSTTGGRRAGFDLDMVGVGETIGDAISGSSFDFRAGATGASVNLFGATAGNAAVDEDFATLDTVDGTDTPNRDGFISLGKRGELDVIYGRSLILAEGEFLFVRGFNANANPGNLRSITIEGTIVPLPASAFLLLGGIGLLAARRRK